MAEHMCCVLVHTSYPDHLFSKPLYLSLEMTTFCTGSLVIHKGPVVNYGEEGLRNGRAAASQVLPQQQKMGGGGAEKCFSYAEWGRGMGGVDNKY